MKITWQADDITPGRQVQMSEFPGITGRWMVGQRLRAGRDPPAGDNIFGLVSLADGMFICFGAGTKDDIAQHLNKDGDYVPVEFLPGRSTDSDHG
jgi:hypothetical protein